MASKKMKPPAKKKRVKTVLVGVGLAAVVVVLVIRFRPKGGPPTATAAHGTAALSLRQRWRAERDRLGPVRKQLARLSGAGDSILPRRDPFAVSEMLKSQFGHKRGAAEPASRPATSGERSLADIRRERIGARVRHFRSAYRVNGILDAPRGRIAMINGRQYTVGGRIEECVVKEITTRYVVLESVATRKTLQERRVECTTFHIDAAPAASLDGHVVRVGEKFDEWTVAKIGNGWVLLTAPVDPRAGEDSETYSFSVRLEVPS
jgi:hypothetical protein